MKLLKQEKQSKKIRPELFVLTTISVMCKCRKDFQIKITYFHHQSKVIRTSVNDGKLLSFLISGPKKEQEFHSNSIGMLYLAQLAEASILFDKWGTFSKFLNHFLLKVEGT